MPLGVYRVFQSTPATVFLKKLRIARIRFPIARIFGSTDLRPRFRGCKQTKRYSNHTPTYHEGEAAVVGLPFRPQKADPLKQNDARRESESMKRIPNWRVFRNAVKFSPRLPYFIVIRLGGFRSRTASFQVQLYVDVY